MNQSQRVVVVVALGLMMLVVGVAAHALLYEPFDPVVWERLTPGDSITSTDSYFVVATDESVVRQALAWLGGIALWAAMSWRILRSRET